MLFFRLTTRLIISLCGYIIFLFSYRLAIMVKRPPSYMPVSKTQELSQKIEFDSASLVSENFPELDDVDTLGEEFINIMMPLIQSGPDDSQSFKGRYNIHLFSYHRLLNIQKHNMIWHLRPAIMLIGACI